MNIEDFSDGFGGYCATSELDGKEFILSHCFKDGTHGVGVAVRKIVHEKMTIPTIGYRYLMLQKGIEIEQKGMRLTGKAPACSAIVKNEYGITKNDRKIILSRILKILKNINFHVFGQKNINFMYLV